MQIDETSLQGRAPKIRSVIRSLPRLHANSVSAGVRHEAAGVRVQACSSLRLVRIGARSFNVSFSEALC